MRSQTAKTILKSKEKVGRLTLLNLKTYYKAIIIETQWYQVKNRHTEQWNKIESLETKLTYMVN